MLTKELLISENTKIKNALKQLDVIEPKVLFVVKSEKLIGTLTDGDIRRYLLNGGNIDEKALLACNKSPKIAKSIKEAKEKYSKDFCAIPIVNDKNKVLNIYIGIENINKESRINIPVVINAGGKGSRLEPYTKVLPKPLIPVGELPIIEHIMKRFESFGCDKFFSIVNYKKQLIKAYFKETENDYNITCIDESTPLGTVGGLSLLKGKIKGDFFFVNCDTLLMSDYYDIYKEHINKENLITVVCANKKVEIPFGVVKTNKKKEFVSIKEKPSFNYLTNVGFYIINEKVLKDIPNNTKIDMPALIEKEIQKGKKVCVFTVDESDWLDMGQMPELERMRSILYGK